jgi:hypothetical chaperone protein
MQKVYYSARIMRTPVTIGVDFGTTNTVVATGDGSGHARLVAFETPSTPTATFRSTLSFNHDPTEPNGQAVNAGPWAIKAYLDDPGETRFIQSFKSYAASSLFKETVVLGRRCHFEDLLSEFLRRLRDKSGGVLQAAGGRVIVGRPVRFVGASTDTALALKRYQTAFERVGFTDILYAYEPVAAAFFFARRLDEDATVLVADFGGGTSDFSIIRFERKGGILGARALGQSGVGVAGDAFDHRIIDNLVSPALGKGSSYRDLNKVLMAPNRFYTSFARWEQLALMRASRDMRDIRALARKSLEPEKIAKLVELLDDNYGYLLYQAVSRLKETLSVETSGRFEFNAGAISLEATVERAAFTGWISRELAAIEAAVDEAMADAGLSAHQIDRVFLTGGSSFVPAVRAIFEARFGAAKIAGGAELESIASGLALMGGESDVERWCERAG